jgi:phage baseplate assembly protein W
MISSLCLSMISAQTRSAFVAWENRFALFRIMLYQRAYGEMVLRYSAL